jgi:non-specific serine/threonine protein kinase/serine/threonine-protein kinase
MSAIYKVPGKRPVANSQLEWGPHVLPTSVALVLLNLLFNTHLLAAEIAPSSVLTNAMSQLEESVKQKRTTLGPDHPETLEASQKLGAAYTESGRTAEAIALLEENFKVCKAKLGSDHPLTLDSMYWLAKAYLAGGRFAQGEALVREQVAETRRLFGPDNRRFGDGLALLGECLVDEGHFAEAEACLRGASPILRKNQHDLLPALRADSLLGSALIGQKKYTEAEGCLLQTHDSLVRLDTEKRAPAATRTLKETRDRLVQLYELWGKPDQAALWRKKLGAPNAPSSP